MSTSIEYASFLVRIWRHRGGDSSGLPTEWHSEMEHIQTGEHWEFETLQDLLDFLRRKAEPRQALTSPLEQLQRDGASAGTPPRQNSDN